MRNILFIFGLLTFIGCVLKPTPPEDRLIPRKQTHMGTFMTVSLLEEQITHSESAFLLFEKLDNQLSTYKKDSEVSLFNSGKSVEFSEDSIALLRLSQIIFNETDGHFDIARGTGKWKLKGQKVEAPLSLRLDFGGIGKGYALDQVKRLFRPLNIQYGILAASGDIFCFHPCFVGVRDPRKSLSQEIIGSGKLLDSGWSLTTSGSDQRGKHIDNPKTKEPARVFLSVTLLGKESNAVLDAWATALFSMPEKKAFQKLSEKPHWHWLIIRSDGKIFSSVDWVYQFTDWSWREGISESSIIKVPAKKLN